MQNVSMAQELQMLNDQLKVVRITIKGMVKHATENSTEMTEHKTNEIYNTTLEQFRGQELALLLKIARIEAQIKNSLNGDLKCGVGIVTTTQLPGTNTQLH